jgi:dolichol-phosphate mannosyltransferase
MDPKQEGKIMKYCIIIPTYNESLNLPNLISIIFGIHADANIIIIDDNSPDGTGEIADTIAKNDSRVRVIHRPKKMGLGTAYVTGFKKALESDYEYIFEMDADFSHDPKYLASFLKTVQKGSLVIGSRYQNGVRVEGWRFRRLLLSKFANMYVSRVMVKPVWDFTSGFRCYHSSVLRSINLDSIHSDGYAFQIEMVYLTYKNGFRVIEIPIIFKERERGFSKISRQVIWEAFWLTLRCRAPLREIFGHLPYIVKDYREFVDSKTLRADEMKPSEPVSSER